MKLLDLFRDDNAYSEKNIIGFLSFAVMSIFAGADIITGILGQELVITDTVFNSFVIITLGAFGIDGATKIFSPKNSSDSEE
jgi:hypothetical protein